VSTCPFCQRKVVGECQRYHCRFRREFRQRQIPTGSSGDTSRATPTPPIDSRGEHTVAPDQAAPLLAGQEDSPGIISDFEQSKPRVRDGVREQAPAAQLPANGFWVGLDRAQLSRAVAIREGRHRRVQRRHALECAEFMQEHGICRIAAPEAADAPAWARRKTNPYGF